MHTIVRTECRPPRAVARPQRVLALIDCADRATQDLLACWLTKSGLRVREGGLSAAPASALCTVGKTVLLTDRFGPGSGADGTILELKERHPGLRIVVIGCGAGGQTAQLSLARAAGADATLPAPVDRERVLELLDRWS